MAEIHNPTKTPRAIRHNGSAYLIRPGATVNLELSEPQLKKLTRLGLELMGRLEFDPSVEPVADGDLGAVDASFSGAFVRSLESLNDEELRAMAKAQGLKLHHKAGRAKLIEALSGDTE